MAKLYYLPAFCLLILINRNIYAQGSPQPLVVYKIGQTKNDAIVTETEAYKLVKSGKPTLITFSMYFKSCPPCVTEIGALTERIAPLIANGTVNYTVVSSVSDSSLVMSIYLKQFISDMAWQFPVYMDTKFTLANALNIKQFPLTILLDTNGLIRYRSTPGTSDIIQLSQLEKMSSQLKKLAYSNSICQFPVSELENMVNKWFSYEKGNFMLKKGFLETGNDRYTQVTSGGEAFEIYWRNPAAEGDVGELTLNFLNEKNFSMYKKSFIDEGYKLTKIDNTKGEEEYKKNEISVRVKKTKLSITIPI